MDPAPPPAAFGTTTPVTEPADRSPTPVLAAADLHKHYRTGFARLDVLRGASVAVYPGEFVCVVGQSGSGKSTLLHLLGLLDRPDAGDVLVNGQSVWAQSVAYANQVRNRQLGFVFQFYHLLPELNVLENVLVPAMVQHSAFDYGTHRGPASVYARELLDRFGLSQRLTHRPAELSGGERQRVAIARALVNRPAVLLADEPTGNLDRRTGDAILEVLLQLNRAGQTIVMVTHDMHVAEMGHRIVRLQDGVVVAGQSGE